MKEKMKYLQIILLMGLMISAPAMAEWEIYCDKDELTGKINGGVATPSLPDNPSTKINPILLGYQDMPSAGRERASKFYIFNPKGFPSLDWDIKCSEYGCTNRMYLTSKFNKDTKARGLPFVDYTAKTNKYFALDTGILGGIGFKKRIRENDNLKIRSNGVIYTFLVEGLEDAIKELRSSCDGVKGLHHIKL